MRIKTSLHTRLWLGPVALILAGGAAAPATTNVPPTPVVLSAGQRPGNTFMDIDYRVNDPDDAFVETAALAFVNGGTGFSNIVKISTLVEGTAANIGSNTPANTTLRLTWNVAADWNTNFGNVQVEILAKDNRALLPFHWITLPSNGPNPEITINNRPIYDADLLRLWYWLIATGDLSIELVNGQILGVGGNYNSNVLAQGTATTPIGREFLWERLNLHSLSAGEIARAKAGRYGLQSVDVYSVARDFVNPDRIYGWGDHGASQLNLTPYANIRAVALGGAHTLVLSGGGITGFGNNSFGQITIPLSATNVVAIAAGFYHSLALKADGTVVGWGYGGYGQIAIPASATNVVAIAAGGTSGSGSYSLALKADGAVVGWGYHGFNPIAIPASATNVTAIAAGACHSLALRADGLVIGWGDNRFGQSSVPASAMDVVAIAAGGGELYTGSHSLALKANGTVVGWGDNQYGQTTIPASATNVTAIAAGQNHSLALRNDGTVIVWGRNDYGQVNIPAGLNSIDLLGVGCSAKHVVVVDKRSP